MRRISELAVLGAAMLIGTVAAVYAEPPLVAELGAAAAQLAALPPEGTTLASLMLPMVIVYPPDNNKPSTRGFGPRAGSARTVTATHFRVWAGYDAEVTLHPYTSGVGPCPEGSNST